MTHRGPFQPRTFCGCQGTPPTSQGKRRTAPRHHHCFMAAVSRRLSPWLSTSFPWGEPSSRFALQLPACSQCGWGVGPSPHLGTLPPGDIDSLPGLGTPRLRTAETERGRFPPSRPRRTATPRVLRHRGVHGHGPSRQLGKT